MGGGPGGGEDGVCKEMNWSACFALGEGRRLHDRIIFPSRSVALAS